VNAGSNIHSVTSAVYRGGFALLPLLWAVNVWLFWPDFRHAHDPEVAKCEHHLLEASHLLL
jgi:Presenilin enhancer-2 subunit of gamma secretase